VSLDIFGKYKSWLQRNNDMGSYVHLQDDSQNKKKIKNYVVGFKNVEVFKKNQDSA